jgi:hypothetical protein
VKYFAEKGRKLSWERARQEWTDAYREKFEKFLIATLYFPDANPSEEPPAEGGAKLGDKSVVFVYRLGSEIPVYGIASVASPFSVSMIPINCFAARTRLIFRLAAKPGAF